MKIFICLLLLSSFTLIAENCSSEKIIQKFFDNLETSNEINEIEQITLFGKDPNNGKIYKLIFDKSDLFSSYPGKFRYGTYQIKSSDPRFINGETLISGGVFDNIGRYGKIESSNYLSHLDSQIGRHESARFYFDENGKLINFKYSDTELLKNIEFKPSNNKALEESY